MQQRGALLRRIADAARAGVDCIQLREKDLSSRELERLAREAVRAVRESSATTKLLINGRADVALALAPMAFIFPQEKLPRQTFVRCGCDAASCEPLIGVSAHTTADVRDAEAQGADFAVLAPIFEKVQTGTPGIGLEALRARACDREA